MMDGLFMHIVILSLAEIIKRKAKFLVKDEVFKCYCRVRHYTSRHTISEVNGRVQIT